MTYSVTSPFHHHCLTKAILAGAKWWSNLDAWWMHMDSWPWISAASGLAPCGVYMQGGSGGGRQEIPEDDQPVPSSDFTEEEALSYHVPVLPAEVVEYLAPAPGKLFLDGTLGGGGHTEMLLRAGAQVIALDQDSEALDHARKRLRSFHSSVCLLKSNFRDFPAMLEEAGIKELDGILVDLGVSSHQLDDASRGFSFQNDGPLDMRMNPQEGRSAATLVNEESAEELERIFRDYGEERQARRIARAMVQRREKKPFVGTADLANFIAGVSQKHGKTHPATLCFQALRIAVNDELGALEALLAEAPRWLKPGGRLVIISFHSLEDRIVKRALQNYATEWHDRPEWPEPRRNPALSMKLLTRKPREAAEAELKSNPRARSAKLRAAERLPL